MELKERLARIAADTVVPVTAGADVQTGAMIALVPRDAQDLALGNEPADNLHITLSYLGKADELDDERKARILEMAEAIATRVPLKAKVSGTAYLKDGKCTVMLVDSAELREIQAEVEDVIGSKSSWPGYLPHVTLDYGDIPLDVNGSLPDEIEFGALRVAFAGENHDFDGLVASALTADIKRMVQKVGRVFDEALHPRAKDGRWIEKGGFVRGTMTFLDKDGKPVVRSNATAKVTEIDGNVIRVEDRHGNKGVASAKTLESAAQPKASLDKPKPKYVPSVLDTAPKKPPRPPETPEERYARKLKAFTEDANELTDDPVQRMQVLDKLMGGLRGSPLTTVYSHNKRGKSRDEWSEERMAQHEELWESILARVDAAGIPREKKALILGGPPGAGKSYSLNPGEPAGELGVVAWDLTGDPPPGVTHVVMNPDVIKDMMVEQGMIPEDMPSAIRPREMASIIHAESNFLTKLFMSRLAAEDLNTAYDSTMANTDHVKKNIRAMAEAGYSFQGLYVGIPKEESRLSAKKRYIEESLANPELGGRFVPSEASGAWDTEGTFKQFTSWFEDGWLMVDNTGVSRGAPRKEIVSRGVGDGSGLDRFLNPPPPKAPTRQGDPKQPSFWTGQSNAGVSEGKPKPVMWKPGMSLADLLDEEDPDRKSFTAAAAFEGGRGLVTDTQLALGLHAGVITADEALEMLRADAVLVSPEVGDDPDEYLGAPTLHHEVYRQGRWALADEISEEVDRLRLEGLVHDSQ